MSTSLRLVNLYHTLESRFRLNEVFTIPEVPSYSNHCLSGQFDSEIQRSSSVIGPKKSGDVHSHSTFPSQMQVTSPDSCPLVAGCALLVVESHLTSYCEPLVRPATFSVSWSQLFLLMHFWKSMHSVKVGTQSVSRSHDPPAPAKKEKFYTKSYNVSYGTSK